ncbi:unnamed protein product [Sphagnum jensenii]|uniref:Uncharacterized protein n=1 Tax=Sphagnum jensenii TaxID=128206 RepID=A0ABP0VI31_9BRYO
MRSDPNLLYRKLLSPQLSFLMELLTLQSPRSSNNYHSLINAYLNKENHHGFYSKGYSINSGSRSASVTPRFSANSSHLEKIFANINVNIASSALAAGNITSISSLGENRIFESVDDMFDLMATASFVPSLRDSPSSQLKLMNFRNSIPLALLPVSPRMILKNITLGGSLTLNRPANVLAKEIEPIVDGIRRRACGIPRSIGSARSSPTGAREIQSCCTVE